MQLDEHVNVKIDIAQSTVEKSKTMTTITSTSLIVWYLVVRGLSLLY